LKKSQSVSNKYYYTGQEQDGIPTDFYNLRARYYYPDIGRFTQEDPILQVGGNICFSYALSPSINPQMRNPYPYVINNPMNFSDITGLWVTCQVIHGAVGRGLWFIGAAEAGLAYMICYDDSGQESCFIISYWCAGFGFPPASPGSPPSGMGGLGMGYWEGNSTKDFNWNLQVSAFGTIGNRGGYLSFFGNPHFSRGGWGFVAGPVRGIGGGIAGMYCKTIKMYRVPCTSLFIM
jgi:RHS repeat-associated protein